jgi:putative DNA primase/helicase
MTNKFHLEKSRLRDYLNANGYDLRNKKIKCPNPDHQDNDPSALIYDNPDVPVVYCPVCEDSWNTFDVAGLLHNLKDFKDQLKLVRETLTIPNDDKKEKSKPISLSLEKAQKIYAREEIEKISKSKDWGEIVGSWKYLDENENVIALDVRFEKEGERKNITTFWYDGKLKWYGTPVFIYNLHLKDLHNPIIIHEGAKCADIGSKNLIEFCHMSWSGGSGKAHLAKWSLIKDREVYILRDDDEPGKKAALKIQKKLPHAKIIKPIEKAREIKKSGADIEEYLQVLSPEELTKYILNKDNIEVFEMEPSEPREKVPLEKPPLKPSNPTDGSISESSIPFKILGIGDDGRAAFISDEGRLFKWTLDSISKNKLMVLTGRSYWNISYPLRNGADWESAADDIIRISQARDFNENHIRGRGAWRDGERISYHDGIKTYGEYCDKKIYLRLPKHDSGICDKQSEKDITNKIKEIVFKMSFETPADAVRCLGWSVLAPFAGALKFRPALLLTGPSGSGKTTVANLCIRKLADCEWFNGSESTVAGVRGKIRYDSRGIMFEEVESDTMKKKTNREELFSLMRVNVSDDAPDTVKGTKEGGYNSFKMQNMFGFIAIDPTVESIADENRIFRVHMVKPENGSEWKKIEKSLIELLSEKNCRSIRSLTWNKLKSILELSDKIVDSIRKITNKDYRSSYSDAMLASAFMTIWTGTDNPTDEQIENMLKKYYSYQPADEHRDEAEEIIDRIMDETIEVIHDGRREKITIMECLNRIYVSDFEEYDRSHIENYKMAAGRYGVRIQDESNIAIVNRHHEIMRIIGRGNGYNKILKRHIGFIEGQRNVHFFDGKTRRCTILRGLLNKNDELENLMF